MVSENGRTNQKMRNYILKSKDKLLNKGRIFSKVEELKSYYNSSNFNNHKNDKLNALLRYAVTNSSFYTSYAKYKNFDEIPVLKKEHIKENYEKFISKNFEKSKLYTGSTSGSTGSPLRFFYSQQKKDIRQAELIFFNKWAGYEVGMKHALNAIGSYKSKLKLFLQNEYLIDPSKIDKHFLIAFKKIIVDKNVKFYIGYPSVIREIASYCQQLKLTPKDFRLKGIISTGEPLDEYTRELAQNIFGCKVLSRYSSLEFGVLAHECSEENSFHLNDVDYHIEVFDLEKDIPLEKPGVGRLIITDLYNYAFPLIRYEIGDLAEISKLNCKCGKNGRVLKSLNGRIVDSLIDSEGRKLSYGHINMLMFPFQDKVERFQFVQESLTEINLKIQTKANPNQFNDLRSHLINEFGKKIKLHISFVTFIDAFKSGKKPFIVNKVLKN
ncbi:phenylacetate-CoA ligase [Psychroflexus salarius]|uniref:Phenylacetate-CoA ligase n=2 Tax=Psychroflexus salarius TaxID=1155689 RepID=A0A1M4V675_9FLAO|nr:phenylacetate-CoA ligase [Psychroflexus salarius]